MAYYFDHRDEVDRRIQEDQAFVEAFRRANASPLQEKLRALPTATNRRVLLGRSFAA
jgi:hypothetical protein